MSYNLYPNNGAGFLGAINPSDFDSNMNPRNVFLLDGVTPASVQERLDESMQVNQRRKDVLRLHKDHMAQSRVFHPLAQYWGPWNDPHLNKANFFPMPQQNMNAQATFAFANAPVHGTYMARPPVPVGQTTGYMQMPNQSLHPEAPTPRRFADPPFPNEQTCGGGQMWENNGSAAMGRHQQEPQQMAPPNYFTRSVRVTETYASNPFTADNNTVMPQNDSSHRKAPRRQKKAQKLNSYVPHTVTEMNEQLNMPKEAEPYADQFQMVPSRKLQRRRCSLADGEEESQTSSGGYKGNPAAGIRNLPDHQNCALWLTNLPADIQPHEVFEVINTGAVSAFEVTRPQGVFVKSAAKLVFKHPEAAARFIDRCEHRGGILIRRHRIKVRYNTFGHCRYRQPERTRMLTIEGPVEDVIYDDLKLYFESFCDHELSGWEFASSEIPGYRKLILGFARINGQATQCLEGLKIHPVYGKVLTVKYASDPCGQFYP
ncbi:hypothetical protein NHQ30_005006 [Ciborinia camelliae]|nr:hypothetical protein NHQ30_005006 [Ciborinia camelliae]